MRAVIVYESMYGNTHKIADAIGEGFARSDTVSVLPAHLVDAATIADADLVVVGGPTHAFGMSRPNTRHAAAEALHGDPASGPLEPDAQSTGVREWLAGLGELHARVAAFDTRLHAPRFLTGRAAKAIARRLRRHGGEVVVPPESFFVTKANRLQPGEGARAQEWGRRLAATVGAAPQRVA